jgi:uncharacterized membrane protein
MLAQFLTQQNRRRELGCGLLLVSLAFSLVLFDEYRLTVNGLLFGLHAIGCMALGRFLLRSHFSLRTTETSISDMQPQLSWNTILRVTGTISFVATAIWAVCIEDTSSAVASFSRINPWTLVLNVGLVFCTCIFGSTAAVLSYQQGIPTTHTSAGLLLFAGLTSLLHLMSSSRSFSTLPQVSVFAGTFAIQFISGCKSDGRSDSENEYAMNPFDAKGMADHNSRSSDSDPEAQSTDSLLEDHDETNLVANEMFPINNQEMAADTCRRSRAGFSMRKHENASPWNVQSQVILILLAFTTWCLFSYLNFSLLSWTSQPREDPALDLSYHPKTELDIVISMYDEEPAFVAHMISKLQTLPNVVNKSRRVLIYFKGEGVNTDNLKHEIGATEIIKIPNHGREGETYLDHILSRFDNLAEHTLFMQADIHNSWEFYRRIKHYFQADTGMLSLGFSGNTCDCNDCWDRFAWQDNFISGFYQEAFNTTCSNVLLSYKGQFIVSARRIRGLDPTIYSSLHEALVNPDSWAHKEPYLRGRPDSMNAPFFGYTLERLWSILFQCSETEIAEKCPTLLSGSRSGGELSGCQCFDGTNAFQR